MNERISYCHLQLLKSTPGAPTVYEIIKTYKKSMSLFSPKCQPKRPRESLHHNRWRARVAVHLDRRFTPLPSKHPTAILGLGAESQGSAKVGV